MLTQTDDMKSVHIQYFAMLKEQAGKSQETLLVSARTYGDLYLHLKNEHHFSLPLSMIQVAVNDGFSQLDREINEGDRIVFIPPMAGG